MEKTSLIASPIAAEMEQFRTLFSHSLIGDNPLLNAVTEHIMQRSGKMMRPMLVLLLAKLLGEVNEVTHRAAVSLELLHNASLVHDDVVDDSDKRRGQLSVNALFNNKVAVLSGDYLLASALVQVATSRHLGIIALVSKLGQDLSDGELLQLSNIGQENFDESVYYQVIRKKTAVLFAACTEAGALSVAADPSTVEKARHFGELIGLCFQIKDDIFDYYDNNIGKPTGNDMKEGKLTLPVLYALNHTADEEAKSIALRVKRGEATPDEMAFLVEFAKTHGGITYAEEQMMALHQQAHSFLDAYPDSPIKTALQTYLDVVVNRTK